MDTLIHADIFFFVTTIAVVAVTIILIVVLVYLIQILRRVRDVSEYVRQETTLFREDIQSLRADVRREGFRIESFFGFIRNIFRKKRSTSKK